MRDGKYQLDLVLRNNITTPEHPLGVFHPHAKLHHIKKENIGLIEVMGLAVLPSRLKKELFELADALVARTPVSQYPEELQKHAEWAEDILARHLRYWPMPVSIKWTRLAAQALCGSLQACNNLLKNALPLSPAGMPCRRGIFIVQWRSQAVFSPVTQHKKAAFRAN